MKELIFVGVGGAGVKIGDQIWEKLAGEHGVDGEGGKGAEEGWFNDHSVFYETQDGRRVPRNVFVDTGPEDVDEIRKGSRRNLYNRHYSITGKEDAANYCVRGQYTIGKMLADEVIDKIRTQIEACDHFGGFIFNCSLSGGTGSGLTDLLVERVFYMHPKITVAVNMTFPSPHMSDIIVEPYNFVFSLGELMSNTERFAIGYDNQQLYKVCEAQGVDQPGFHEINELIARYVATLTSKARSMEGANFFGDINTSLIPYNKMFSLSPSFVNTKDRAESSTIASSLYNSSSCLNSYRSIGQETILTSYAILRGQITHFQALNSLMLKKKSLKCINWCPNSLKASVVAHPLRKSVVEDCIEGAMLVNSSSIMELVNIQTSKYDRLFQKRAYIHWYVGQGLDDDFITSNRGSLQQLRRDYEQMCTQQPIDD